MPDLGKTSRVRLHVTDASTARPGDTAEAKVHLEYLARNGRVIHNAVIVLRSDTASLNEGLNRADENLESVGLRVDRGDAADLDVHKKHVFKTSPS